jgi:hypothetical protein
MITDKQKKKIWHRCYHNAVGLVNNYQPWLSNQAEDVREHLKSKKEELFQNVPEPQQMGKKSLCEYEEAINQCTRIITLKMIKEIALPNMKRYKDALEKIICLLDELKVTLKSVKFNCQKREKHGWVGADVCVTSDSTIDPTTSHDKIVLISNPEPLTMLMISLRNICKSYLNFTNKYHFYGMIAEISNQYISEKGDPGDEQAEMLELVVNAVMELIGSEKKWTETRFRHLKSLTLTRTR